MDNNTYHLTLSSSLSLFLSLAYLRLVYKTLFERVNINSSCLPNFNLSSYSPGHYANIYAIISYLHLSDYRTEVARTLKLRYTATVIRSLGAQLLSAQLLSARSLVHTPNNNNNKPQRMESTFSDNLERANLVFYPYFR